MALNRKAELPAPLVILKQALNLYAHNLSVFHSPVD
jgi:hypothetical protein